VLPKRKAVPSPVADAKAGAKQLKAALKVAVKLATNTAPAGTVRIGEAGKGGVERFAFTPSELTVAPGTTVNFAMPTGSREDHTATTGPGDPEKAPTSYLGKLAASFNSPVIDAIATYPSDPPAAGPAALTPQLHGNGFWSSGVLDTTPATPLPASGKVTFAAAGTYEFYCLIHPFMHATVTVK
jgi:plastocyanin